MSRSSSPSVGDRDAVSRVTTRPVLGRRDECAVLDELLSTVGDGFGRALVLYGDAGMGKTRLLEHAVDAASGTPAMWITGVEAERELGFAGLHQLLRPLLVRRSALPGPQRDALGAAFGIDGSAPAEPFTVALASLTLLADAAAEHGLVCVIDDAQWVDEESLAALAFVARRVSADRLAVLFGFRGTEAPAGPLEGLPTIAVGGLGADAATELLATYIDVDVEPELARRIVDETGGCPLALLDLASELTDDEIRGGRAVSGPLPVGRRLENHYLHQARSLEEASQTFLLVAAAEATGDGALVRAAAAALGADGAAEDAAVCGGLLSITSDGGVAFRHPLVRSAVYRGAPGELRRRAHRAIAANIDRDVDPDRRVRHLAAAARGFDDALADELEDAARRARQRGSFSTESDCFQQSAQLTSDPHRRSVRLLGAANAEHQAGRLPRVDVLLQKVRPLLTDPLLVAEATRLAAFGARRRNLQAAPQMLLDAARSFLPVDRDRARSVLLDAMHAALITQEHMSGTSLDEIAGVVLANPAEHADPPSMTDVQLDAVAVLVSSGHQEATPLLQRAAEVLRNAPTAPSFTDAYMGVTITNELWDDSTQALWCTRVYDSAVERNVLGPRRSVVNALARYETRAGRFASAEAYYQEAIAIEAASGGMPEVTEQLKCDLHAWRGRDAETIAAATALSRLGRSVGAANFEHVAQVALARLALSQGRYTEALDALRPIVDSDAPGFACQVLAMGVEAGRRADDDAVAAECLRRLEERAPAAGTPLGLGQLAWARALCAAEADEAERLYHEATTLLATTSIATDQAHAHLLYGEWLRRENRRHDARRQLRAAHERFAAMGADGFARRAMIELAALGDRPRRRSVETQSRLTPQEANVARLAAAGATNPEIATRLFISTSTVDYHLRKVFLKLDVSSRRQLAQVDLEGP